MRNKLAVQVVKELEDLGVQFENEVTHDELIKFGFKLNFPHHPQAFYSFELDDETQFYYSNNKLSLFKKHIGNVHQFQNINSLNNIYNIIKIFVKDECWCHRKLKKCKMYMDCLQMNTKTFNNELNTTTTSKP